MIIDNNNNCSDNIINPYIKIYFTSHVLNYMTIIIKNNNIRNVSTY